ncbi:uncharacterized protein BP5553_01727 [Venustampulla echinocandica]|uniref:Uncharacterized protein n=1 Tax=Venustampulla echinocandica TaxID=2656787 RepID=A0A370U1U8_9HELO|nr:uncharacterized protein BP5553_01727 [Venustampulla echinocandica]RDL41748.1 hypothetical protein BP5553_01727 [Venustampulla echinocandica]
MAFRQSWAQGDDARLGATQHDYIYDQPYGSGHNSSDDIIRKNPIVDSYELNSMSADPNLGLMGKAGHAQLNERARPGDATFASPYLPKLWTPFFLRRLVLLGFAAMFFGLMLILGILYGVSQKQLGLSTVTPSLYYLWRYGPTAVFALIAAFWGQIEYRTKQLAPWKNMADSPQVVDRSLLLDYVSPINVGVFYRSVRMRDWAVAAAVTGSFLIKLIIIASTGLFADNFVHLNIEVTDLPVLDRFKPGSLNMSNLNSRPIHRIYGVRALNMTYPAGTTAQHAFTNIDTSPIDDRVSSVNATLDVFTSTVRCELANIDRIDTHTVQGSSGVVMLPNGTRQDIPLLDPSKINLTLSLSSPSCHYSTQYIAPVDDVFEILDVTPKSDCADHGRFLYIYGITTINTTQSDVDRKLVDAQYFLCLPQYSILPGNVLLHVNTSASPLEPEISFPPTSKPLQDGASAIYFVQAMSKMLSDNGAIRIVRYLNGSTSQNVTTDFRDSGLLQNGLETYFTQVITQMASIYHRVAAKNDTTGTLDIAEYRLHLQTFSFVVIEVMCGLLVALSVSLALRAKNTVVSRDPGPIGGLAAIVSRSGRLESTLHQSGSASLSSTRNILGYSRFSTTTSATGPPHGFAILPTIPDSSESKKEPEDDTNMCWYRPWTTTFGAKIALVTLPLMIVAALEVCYTASRRSNGLSQLGPDTWVRLAYTYIPTSILVCLGLCFGSLDFTTKMFQPYKALQHGGMPAEATINVDYHSRVGLHALWSALRLKHIPVISISLAMVAAPFLSIITSGLFSTDILPQSTDLNVIKQDAFSLDNFLSESGLADEKGADQGLTVANLVITDNVTDPQWTHGTLALPKFKIPDQVPQGDARVPINGSILTTTLLATRGLANCTILPTDQITNATYINGTVGSKSTGELVASAIPPNKCGRSHSMAFNNKTMDFSIPVMDGKHFGKWEFTDRQGWDNKTCPTFWIISGRVVNMRAQDVTMLYCSPYLERVQAEVTVTLPDYGIDHDRPPVVNDNNRTRVGDATMPYRWQESLYLPFVTNDTQNIMNIISDDLTGDGFFGALTKGKDGIPIAQLSGSDNSPKLASAVENLYGKVIAQIMNFHRVDLSNATSPLQAFPATLITPNRIILRQSPISTRILDVLLIIMAICAALTYWFLDTTKTLPKNPSSIGAVASLLAGSEMLRMIPEGAEWGRDYRMFDGWFFGLGWWGSGDKKRFGVDVGSGEKGGEGNRLI